MKNEEIKMKVREYIEKNLIVFDSECAFTDENDIFKLGLVNSLFAMKLLTFVEKTFSVVVENDDINIANFNSIENILKLINRKRGE